MRLAPRSLARCAVALALAAALPFAAPSAAQADGPARHETLREFQPTGKFEWEPAEKTDKTTVLYFSVRAAAYVLRGAGVPAPILVRTATRGVESFPEDAALPRDDGGFDLKADVKFKELGKFELDGMSIKIAVEGLKGRLVPAHPVLGWHKADDLLTHRPEYARDAKAYTPVATDLDALRACKADVRVFVYFGTWCSTCTTVMGRILRVEQELAKGCKDGEKPHVQVDYYGLPAAPATWTDPEAVKYALDTLPTALVYVDGALCSKLYAAELNRPETSLRAILGPK